MGVGSRASVRIEARGLTKRYGSTVAVDNLSFDVLPARSPDSSGPNGAGKSTTLRMVLGLDRPSAGSVSIGGRPYSQTRRPLFEVGALLDAKAMHPGRSAFNNLLCLAQSNGIPRSRVHEVLDIVGLTGVSKRRAGSFSLGMGQRLGIAAALLGDPDVLLFDEPVNGLDTEGIVWIRTFMRSLAAEGRTVLVSSHLMSEMALTADHVIVVGPGQAHRSGLDRGLRGPQPPTTTCGSAPHDGLADAARSCALRRTRRRRQPARTRDGHRNDR